MQQRCQFQNNSVEKALVISHFSTVISLAQSFIN